MDFIWNSNIKKWKIKIYKNNLVKEFYIDLNWNKNWNKGIELFFNLNN